MTRRSFWYEYVTGTDPTSQSLTVTGALELCIKKGLAVAQSSKERFSRASMSFIILCFYGCSSTFSNGFIAGAKHIRYSPANWIQSKRNNQDSHKRIAARWLVFFGPPRSLLAQRLISNMLLVRGRMEWCRRSRTLSLSLGPVSIHQLSRMLLCCFPR